MIYFIVFISFFLYAKNFTTYTFYNSKNESIFVNLIIKMQLKSLKVFKVFWIRLLIALIIEQVFYIL